MDPAPPGPDPAPPPRPPPAGEPVRRPGRIPPSHLDENALTVVRRLQHFGHQAYLVGGCVRDLLCGLEPKDFDVATDAWPARIKRLFRNARIIGRRFRLAHIRFGPDAVVETSTFRRAPRPGEVEDPEDSPPGDRGPEGRERARNAENLFGTAPEDARRRDFTINALFYDPVEDQILDYVGGLEDLEAGIVRSIGDPVVRIHEDPVRMIRAAHFAERMGFRLEPTLERAIHRSAATLAHASPARLYVELLKVLQRARARSTLRRLHDLEVLPVWLPELVDVLEATDAPWPAGPDGTHDEARHGEPADVPAAHATWNLLGAADRWGMVEHRAEEALLLAPLLGPWLVDAWRSRGAPDSPQAFETVFDETLRPLARRMSIPRRTQARLCEALWLWLQMRHPPGTGRRPPRLVHRHAWPLARDLLRLDLMGRDCPLDLLGTWEALDPGSAERDARDALPRGPQRRVRRRGEHRGGRDRRDPRRAPDRTLPATEPRSGGPTWWPVTDAGQRAAQRSLDADRGGPVAGEPGRPTRRRRRRPGAGAGPLPT